MFPDSRKGLPGRLKGGQGRGGVRCLFFFHNSWLCYAQRNHSHRSSFACYIGLFLSREPIMRRLVAWTLTWAAMASLVCQAPRVAFAQTPAVVTIDECRNLSDAEVRDRIRDVASTSLKTELAAIDFAALVNIYLGEGRRERAHRPRNRRRHRARSRGHELDRPRLLDRKLSRPPSATQPPSPRRPIIRKGSRTR